MRRHLVVAVSHGTHSERLKSKLGESVKRLRMTARRVSVGVNVALLKIEHEYIKLSLSGYLRVKLTERACRRVSRVSHKSLSPLLALGVELLKYRSRHIYLASDGQRERLVKSKGYRLNRAEIERNVLSDSSVASGRTLDELAVLVYQRDRETVYLGLYRIYGSRKLAFHLVAEILGLLKGKDVRERVHSHAVCDLLKFIKSLAANALSGRIRIVERRVLFLKALELGVHHIVLIIGYFGRIVHIISLGMVIQLLTKRFHPVFYLN